MDDAFGFAKHLCLRYPEGGCGHGDGEIVYLDAVELVDADLDGVGLLESEERLAVVADVDDLVLQAAQREVGLGEEVAAAASRVEESELREFVLVGIQPLVALV